ncbi:MAG: Rne/Rng family ribonuclease [Candidatus Eisenbacteria bacterium]|nr:Rne/Rng family ribonuclease [Candidatus Eisenbacteria bacterium]
MKKEIVVNSDVGETRIAILEDGELVELVVERMDRRRNVGDIYKSRVNAVLPGMQAAFVNLGLSRTAFLHVSDLRYNEEEYEEYEEFDEDKPKGKEQRGEAPTRIEDLLEKGQEILVQVTKEAIGAKGPRVSGQISLPGRYIVFMPGLNHIGVSRRIAERDERRRLRALISEIRPKSGGIIVRTAGEGKGKREFLSDVKFLMRLWERIEKKAARSRAPALVNREMELTSGLIRDIFTADVNQLVIDSRKEYRQIMDYLRSFAPELRQRVKLYKENLPIFDYYDIESEIDKLVEEKVWLKKGGYITIDPTEALTTIDVNTGRYTGRKSQEDTIFKTNLEAAKEIARQLRLRDIGGIIVIDFIDMESEGNKRAIMDELRQCLKKDRARTKTFQVSDLGLVEMTRQREGPSIVHYFTEDCPTCEGTGKVLSMESVMMKMTRLVRGIVAKEAPKKIEVRVHPDVAVYVVEENSWRLDRLEKELKTRIDVRDDPGLRREEMKVLLPGTAKK